MLKLILVRCSASPSTILAITMTNDLNFNDQVFTLFGFSHLFRLPFFFF